MDASPIPPIPLNERRLNKPYMYKMVFQGGRALRGVPLTLRFLPAEKDHSRIGFIIRKKVGNACMRNSIRRLLRLSFQQALPSMGSGLWIIFDVSEKAVHCRKAELRGEANKLLEAASRLRVQA